MARLQVKVKPNAPETKILAENAGILTVAVAAPPENNKANRELVKFLTKKLKKIVKIKAGFGKTTKMLEIID